MNKEFKFNNDESLDLDINWDLKIESAYIITVEGDPISERKSAECAKSCDHVGQSWKKWGAYNGIDRETIRSPDHLKNIDHMKWIKIMDHGLSITEVACFLSHISLWAHCITINRPIVILEHDALMIRKIEQMAMGNIIEYLGHVWQFTSLLMNMNFQEQNQSLSDVNKAEIQLKERLKSGEVWIEPKLPFIHAANRNYTFPLGFHAYAIDPLMAKKLYADVLLNGITNPADVVANCAKYTLVQRNLYAMQDGTWSTESTIDQSLHGSPFKGRKDYYQMPGLTL